MSLEEKNKATLKRAVESLPDYAPGPHIWESVSQALHPPSPRALLGRLPDYDPPAQVWEAIDRELSTPSTQAALPLRRSLRRLRLVQVAVAASIALLALFTWKWWSDRPVGSVEIIYSEETPSDRLFEEDWNQDAPAFEEVLRQYASNPLLRGQPGFRNLHDELEELNEAKKEIEEMIDQYGRDPGLIRQIGEIERQRSEVLKKIVILM